MAVNGIGATLPQPNVPFLDENGGISRAWFYYMIVLLKRTGGSPGISADALQAEINALQIESAMSGVAPQPPNLTFSAADLMAPPIPPQSLPSAALLAMCLSNPPAPTLDPILAALMVS